MALSGCDALLRLDKVEPVPDALVLTCPLDYTRDDTTHSYYRPVMVMEQFVAAATDCADDETFGLPVSGHTHLTVISDAMEQQRLHAIGPTTWVGITDLAVTSTWRWVTAEPSVDPAPTDRALWSPGEPNSPGAEDCGVFDLSGSGTLNNVGCTELHEYVCECDAYQNVSATYQ